MSYHRTLLLAIAAAQLLSAPAEAESGPGPFLIQLELGPVWQTRNDVQIPNDSGTRFSLTSLGSGPQLAYRAYFAYRLASRHELRALIAPLTVKGSGRLPQEVRFQDQTFGTSTETEGLYRFNSYRLTYSYLLYSDSGQNLRLGFTGKIRDAEIRLTQGAIAASRENVGFVPLIHLNFEQRFTEQVSLELDLDGAWSPYGRAEDLALHGNYRIDDSLALLAGYRTVEGGSDGGGAVYTFAWLHYFVMGARFQF